MQITPSPYQKLSIETPENIQLEYELAAPGSRFMAYMIDYFILNIIVGTLSFAFFYAYISSIKHTVVKDFILYVILSVYGIFYVLGGYFILFETLWSGQTPGKRYVGIRVIQDNGLPVTFTQIVLRNIARLIDCNLPIQYGIGIAYMLSDRSTRRIGDVAANTLVVKNKKPITIKEAIKIQPTPEPNFDVKQFYLTLPFDYKQITTTELSMMHQFWEVKNEISQKRAFELVEMLVKPILVRLNLTNLAKYNLHQIDPQTKMNGYYLFIRDVIRAYKYEDLSPYTKKVINTTTKKIDVK
ncbi:MAG: RDD family protein [Bacteroidia bacterium]|nr:RDD family protein [Bacteroidia bacterium]MDW8347704.1 RDD family protein [Bacteroidia bacterium]